MGTPTNIRLFVSDVDGTLLNAKKELSDATRKAIKKLQDSGVAVSLVSSRPPRGMQWIIDELGILHACAALNGGMIFDPDLSVLSEYHLHESLASEIVAMLEERGFSPWVYTDSDWYVRSFDAPHVSHETDAVRFEPIQFESVADIHGPIIKITGINDDESLVAAAQHLIGYKFCESVSVSRSLPNRIEITHYGANKATAVTAIAAAVGVDAQSVATAGDGENDIPMFRNSSFSIAMGQAPGEVRRAATQTTTPNSTDGLAWAIGEYLLKPRA